MSNNEVKKRSNTEFSSRLDGFSTSSLEIPCSILDIRFRFPSFFSPFITADGSKKWEGLEAKTCPVFYGLMTVSPRPSSNRTSGFTASGFPKAIHTDSHPHGSQLHRRTPKLGSWPPQKPPFDLCCKPLHKKWFSPKR